MGDESFYWVLGEVGTVFYMLRPRRRNVFAFLRLVVVVVVLVLLRLHAKVGFCDLREPSLVMNSLGVYLFFP